MCMWRSEKNFQVLVFFNHMNPGNETQEVEFGGKHLYMLGHLTRPNVFAVYPEN